MIDYLNMRVRLKDIAEATGYSINTVSRALRNMSDISDDTRKKISEQAEQMGYVVNSQASYLRTGQSKTIAVIMPDVSNLFFAYLLDDIETEARQQGYSTIFLTTGEDIEKEAEALQTAISKNVDGIIWTPVQNNGDSAAKLRAAGIPFVLLSRKFDDLETDYVICDEFESAYLITKHIISKGHRNFIFVLPPEYNFSSARRRKGFKKAVDEAGIEFAEDMLCEVQLRGDFYRNRLSDELHKNPEITAILAFNDMMAWSIGEFLITSGRSVPDDISLAGFDHLQSRLRLPLQLTTVDINKTRMANNAADILFSKINGEIPIDECVQKVVSVRLYEGMTVKDINNIN